MRTIGWVLIFATIGCERRSAVDAGAAALPWQPEGLRSPKVKCEMAVPAGLTLSPSPMPDHLAELFSKDQPPRTSVTIAERVENGLPAAVHRVRAFHWEGLLTTEGATVLANVAVQGAAAPGQELSVRWGAGQIESVTLLAFEGLPIVEVVARYPEADGEVKAGVASLVRSLRCTKK
jgi:hypothetical protein